MQPPAGHPAEAPFVGEFRRGAGDFDAAAEFVQRLWALGFGGDLPHVLARARSILLVRASTFEAAFLTRLQKLSRQGRDIKVALAVPSSRLQQRQPFIPTWLTNRSTHFDQQRQVFEAICENPSIIKDVAASVSNAAGAPAVRVHLMFHGTSLAVARSILGGGFANLTGASTGDSGYFGTGIYFTHSPEYAILYARLSCKDKPRTSEAGMPAVIGCMVGMHNPHPIVDMGMNGKALVRGHDAHIVIVRGKTEVLSTFKPRPPFTLAAIEGLSTFTEVVVQDGEQALPVFVVLPREE